MDKALLEKVKQFLYQLHYEETDRESHYESQAYKSALQEKERQSVNSKTVIQQLPMKDRQLINICRHGTNVHMKRYTRHMFRELLTVCRSYAVWE